MFEDLTIKLEGIFKKLRGQGRLSENNIKDALKEVRRALLEADVNYKVVRDFVSHVEAKAIGQEVLRSITPGQQVIKIVYEELTALLGKDKAEVKFSAQPPTIFMLVGLQGSGKTTACGKLARFYRKKGRFPLLVAADIYRPAAIDQLKILGKSLDIPVFSIKDDPVKICDSAVEHARKEGKDLITRALNGPEMTAMMKQHAKDPLMEYTHQLGESMLKVTDILEKMSMEDMSSPDMMPMHHMHIMINHALQMAVDGANLIMLGQMGMAGEGHACERYNA